MKTAAKLGVLIASIWVDIQLAAFVAAFVGLFSSATLDLFRILP